MVFIVLQYKLAAWIKKDDCAYDTELNTGKETGKREGYSPGAFNWIAVLGYTKEISQLRLMLESECDLYIINKRGLPTKEIPILA